MRNRILWLSAFACFLNTSFSFAYVGTSPFHNHFFDSKIDQAKIKLVNTHQSEKVRVRLELQEIVPRRDGTWDFKASSPGLYFERSLIPFVSVQDDDGINYLNSTIELDPRSEVMLKFDFNFPLDKRNGSYHAILRSFVEGAPSSAQISYIFFTHDSKFDLNIRLGKFKYNQVTEKLDVTVFNRGNTYTYAEFDLEYIDPTTNYKVNKTLGIPNYLLPEKGVKKSYDISPHLAFFDKMFKKDNPGKELPKVIILRAKMRYGTERNIENIQEKATNIYR